MKFIWTILAHQIVVFKKLLQWYKYHLIQMNFDILNLKPKIFWDSTLEFGMDSRGF